MTILEPLSCRNTVNVINDICYYSSATQCKTLKLPSSNLEDLNIKMLPQHRGSKLIITQKYLSLNLLVELNILFVTITFPNKTHGVCKLVKLKQMNNLRQSYFIIIFFTVASP